MGKNFFFDIWPNYILGSLLQMDNGKTQEISNILNSFAHELKKDSKPNNAKIIQMYNYALTAAKKANPVELAYQPKFERKTFAAVYLEQQKLLSTKGIDYDVNFLKIFLLITAFIIYYPEFTILLNPDINDTLKQKLIIYNSFLVYLYDLDKTNKVSFFLKRIDEALYVYRTIVKRLNDFGIKQDDDRLFENFLIHLFTEEQAKSIQEQLHAIRSTNGQQQYDDDYYEIIKNFYGAFIEDAKKVEESREKYSLTDGNLYNTIYDLSVGRTEGKSWVCQNIFYTFKLNSKIFFRPPQNIIRNDKSKAFLVQPIVYLLGSISTVANQVDWRDLFIPILSKDFLVFNPKIRLETHRRNHSIYDEFVADVALLSSDVIIIYIDEFNRGIDILIQAVFYILNGFPVVLIIQNILDGYYSESRNEINNLRDHVRHMARDRHVPVFNSFTEFSKYYAVEVSGRVVIDAEKLKASVSKEVIDASLLKPNAQALAVIQRDKSDYFDIARKSLLYSTKPIFKRLMVDIDGKLVESDKSFTFSVLNSVKVDEFFSLLNYTFFNSLGIIRGKTRLGSETLLKMRYEFKNIKENLKIKYLKTKFYEKPEFFETEIEQFLRTDGFDESLQKLPNIIEIQVTMHFIIQIINEIFHVQLKSNKEYLAYIKDNKHVNAFFSQLIGPVDIDEYSEIQLFQVFAKTYVLTFINEVNESRFILTKLLCLYPEVLNYNTRFSLQHLASFYKFNFDINTGTFIAPNPSKNILQFGDMKNYMIFLIILDEYYNSIYMSFGNPPFGLIRYRN